MSEQVLVTEDYADVSLLYNEFMVPAYQSALATIDLVPGMHVLDLGCGAGGLLALLDKAVGPNGCITGVDGLQLHLDAAQSFAEQHNVQSELRLVEADLCRPLEFADYTFDCVWCADVLFALPEPAAVVREMVRVTKPGGTVAIFSGNYYRASLLPGYRRLEWLAVESENLYSLSIPGFYADFSNCPMPNPYERTMYWLQAAGLHSTSLTVHPVYYHQPLPPSVRKCLEKFFFEYVLQIAVRTSGAAVGMSAADIHLFEELTTPGSDKYILDEPDYYCLQTALLATGRR